MDGTCRADKRERSVYLTVVLIHTNKIQRKVMQYL
jgi:hypothetical protein